MEVFGLGVVLMLTNWMSVDDHLGPATIVNGVADCLVHCYQNVTCSGVFYNNVEKLCYSSLKVHSTTSRLVSDAGVTHYGFTAGACPYSKGYTYFRGAQLCMKRIYPDTATPDDAADKCQEDGGRLVHPQSPIHQVVMFSSYFGCFWIGGYRDVSNDSFWWPDGNAITYLPWQPGDPRSGINLVRLAACEDGWKTLSTTHELTYMCEIPFHTLMCPH
ncbi:brevican core protein-like [Haliotis asinina]|uniref:brevican core protein-like n=1 Tax=Haliotis asinina TaxID=109174 RepID=UPI00353268A4